MLLVLFCENFIFAKRHICHVKNVRLGHDFPTSVNDIVILPAFYFHKTLQQM